MHEFLSPPLAAVPSLLRAAAGSGYALAQALLLTLSAHRYVTLWRAVRARPPARPAEPADWPAVTVQLPVYNERLVVERLIAACARLDYPRERFELQVLDDSTDDTRDRVDRAAAAARAAGVRVRVLRRSHRHGYKAGALAAGLREATGELVAIFDADFVPAPDFLRRIVPHFAAAGVGLVQARWGHLNRDRSALTAAQAAMLDAHFRLEHGARCADGLFFNFNGTAGVWRRRCIEESGGWSHDTLTEDLDLSYRAQLAGWRFVYDDSIEVPAELPAEVEALKSQQRRWAKGSIQTARKILPRLLRARLPWRVRVEAVVHLTGNAAYPLLLALSLLFAPVLLAQTTLPHRLVLAMELGVALLGIVPVTMFLVAGQMGRGRSAWRVTGDVVAALVLGVGLALNNSRAVFAGLGSRIGDWERTPKTGEGARAVEGARYRSGSRRTGAGELLLAIYFAGLLVVAWSAHHWRALPFVLLLLAGFTTVSAGSWGSRRRAPTPAE